ncbi:MAG: phage integrase SAM-like domain-containing protein, partial [Thermoproteota archaeon]|nr:phage integrase SAM-like domain-containing protein [Thermoproteota archaeon]
FTPEQIKELEEQKAEYQQEINRAQKQIKELVQLPQLSIREMKEYLDVKLGRKGPESKQLAEVALRHWQKYLLSRDLPNREINEVDINSFVAQLRRKMNSPYTRANYLGQLVSYFKYAYSKEIAILIQKEKSKADGEIAELKKNTQPLRIRDVKRFYREANHPLKVAIRLLLLEKSIGIDDLGKINVIQEANGKYHFFQEKTEIEIDADTAKMAIPLLKCNKGKLVKGKRRSLADRFQRFSDKLHFEPNITPVDLHKFGRKLHPDDIKEFILT